MDDRISARLDAIEQTQFALQMQITLVYSRLGLPGSSTADRIAAEKFFRDAQQRLDPLPSSAFGDGILTPEQRARLNGG